MVFLTISHRLPIKHISRYSSEKNIHLIYLRWRARNQASRCSNWCLRLLSRWLRCWGKGTPPSTSWRKSTSSEVTHELIQMNSIAISTRWSPMRNWQVKISPSIYCIWFRYQAPTSSLKPIVCPGYNSNYWYVTSFVEVWVFKQVISE
jgi:hypothetical protein